MQFQEFSQLLSELEGMTGRNQMGSTLAEFLPKLEKSEIKQALYLMQGRLVPQYIDLEFNLSRKLALKAISELSDVDTVDKLFASLGDEGLVAEEVLATKIQNSKFKIQSIEEVYSALEVIAKASGAGSQESKVSGLKNLLANLDPVSARYVVRVVIGNLRLGLSEKTILEALSLAKVGSKQLKDELERAFGSRADLGELALLVLPAKSEDVEKLLAEIKLKPGVPVASKLVEREKDVDAIFKRMGASLVQPKLDGLRAQIHIFDGEVQIFSRNMESLTAMFPDLIAAALQLPLKSAIIDSEAIGYDADDGSYLPFQDTIQRRRKHDVESAATNIPVKAMAFDLLYLDGEDLSRQPVEMRTQILREILQKAGSEQITLLETVQVETAEELDAYFTKQIAGGLEGVIVKKLGTPYEPGTRNFDWIKFKASARADFVDTVDVVVIGYFRGQGARAKFGIGALLVAVYDPEAEIYYSIAKVGTGMSDANWTQIKSDLVPLEVAGMPAGVQVAKVLYPDVWVRPEIVMEVEADQITRSTNHVAARGVLANFEPETEERGLSLRFPRMKVWKRDKRADQATTVKELVRMYELRTGQAKAS